MKKSGLSHLLWGTVYAAICAGTAILGTAHALAQPDVSATNPSAQGPQSAPGASVNPSGQTSPNTVLTKAVDANIDLDDKALLNADQNKNDWLLHGRTYDNQRFSHLMQINAKNVHTLLPVSIIQTSVANSFEDDPIEVSGVLYVVTASDHVFAYDAVTGEQFWSYTPTLEYSDLCCGPLARGVAVAHGKVFVAQLDARVVALDARTGKVLWKTNTTEGLPAPARYYSFTMAPQVYDGMVIVGSSCGQYPARCFVEALDMETGKPVWQFNTTAAPGEPGGDTWSGDSWKVGGGSVWNTPAVDPKNGLIFFGEGNPNPDVWGEDRKGDNAYTDSIVALDAKTGKLAWWYQQVPHDQWDYDAAGPVILFDQKDHGKMVPIAAEAGKVGNVFILNRLTGKLIRKSDPFVLQSTNMFMPPSTVPETVYPGVNGGSVWSPAAYSPLTHYFYVMGQNEAFTYTTEKPDPITPDHPLVGQLHGGMMRGETKPNTDGAFTPFGSLSAINMDTGKIAWQYKADIRMQGGVLATASNLVFAGEGNGYFDAFDARSGKKLWHFFLGTGVNAPPITYSINGVQYVTVAAGGHIGSGLRAGFGDVVAIFALPGETGH